MKNNNKTRSCIALICFLLPGFGGSLVADELRDASRLLVVTNMESQFEAMTLRQTRNIIRTYESIVASSTDATLPQSIKNTIAACYADVYAWEKFEPGIARIFADNLTEKELRLLINFYRSLGLPPNEIATFKNTIAKAEHIKQLSAEYIFSRSEGCVEQDARLILGYLDETTAD